MTELRQLRLHCKLQRCGAKEPTAQTLASAPQAPDAGVCAGLVRFFRRSSSLTGTTGLLTSSSTDPSRARIPGLGSTYWPPRRAYSQCRA